ncbi:MAG TPA: hypothetical protein VMU32_02115 [Solirubrobacteraceae bacterium]|nr:hypothetical protein [Solirubrobacteraceae bacterium]
MEFGHVPGIHDFEIAVVGDQNILVTGYFGIGDLPVLRLPQSSATREYFVSRCHEATLSGWSMAPPIRPEARRCYHQDSG